MKKCIVIPIVLILVLGVAGGAAFMFGVIKPPEVEGIQNAWGEVSTEQTEVRTAIVLNNPNSIDVGLGNVGLDVGIALNDVRLGQGQVGGIELPQGQSTTNLVTIIDNTAIPAWWASHVGNEERTSARITPTVRASIFGRSLNINIPAITRDIDTDILEGVNTDEPEAFPVGPFTVTVKSRTFQWGDVSEQTTEIDGELVLHQDSPAPVVMTRLDFTFVMNGIVVAEATTREAVILPPNTDTPVPFSANITNLRLIEWWPTHIGADERTDYQIQVDVVLEVQSGLLGGERIPVRVLEFEDHFETDVLGRKAE